MRALLVIALCASISARAQTTTDCQTSTLQIHTDLHLPIKVYVDGSTGDNPPTVGVTVSGIPPGRHELKVVEMYEDDYGDQKKKTVYSGTIDVHPSVHMDARVDEGKGLAVHDTHVPCGAEDAALSIGTDPATSPTSPTTTPAAPAASPANTVPDYMSDDDFQQLVNTIVAAQYEVRKLDTLKQVIGSSKVSTDQVRQVMALFSFESNKVEAAKLLYDHTVDPKNYATLGAVLQFDDSKKAFKQFMQGK